MHRRDNAAYTVTCVPTSTTRPVGIWKKSVASLADLARPMNSLSCQSGMPEWAAGRIERRDEEERRRHDVELEALLAQERQRRAGCSAFPCSRS